MNNKYIAALAAVAAVAAVSMIALPILSQTPPDRPPVVDEARWVPISERVGIELVDSGRIESDNVQPGHLWVSNAGSWRRVQLVRSVQALPASP